MRKLSLILALAMLLCLILPIIALAEGPANLLANPGFEAPYGTPIPGKENCFIAGGWSAWYVEGSSEETTQGYRHAPEYKMSVWGDKPGNRVRSDAFAQQWFKSYANFQAGIYQVVPNVTPGARYRFDLWSLVWSCDNEKEDNCDGYVSDDPSNMHLRIGIDPQGGTSAFSPSIVWGPEQNAYDAWTAFSVEAVAAARNITVFVYSYPEFRSQDNNIYVDDASLTLVAAPVPPTPKPTAVPPTVAPAAVPPTVTPTAVPPTVAPTAVPPTAAPTAAPTVAPTATPLPTAVPTVKPTDKPTAVPPTAVPPTQVPPTQPPPSVAPAQPTVPPATPVETTSGSGGFGTTAAVSAGAAAVVAAVVVILRRRRR